ncbi:TonB-dependent siderophore receptor [Cupriavidus agavae]|uniref:Outer membrane receptor for ferric coprogen and ferric-rhodotorulic acid n=1 Tax=Cupriavidus agavae TaxID=1001822 RepID=A0A4Q7RZW3_9BURK|nr:TonB-dependent siderophore receptor [Cupriavidus agavae]RZT39414.1 outer membrane receptor for ferric coprogen and ferric-rhodotorulic acid [Cupriavidus agavae]
MLARRAATGSFPSSPFPHARLRAVAVGAALLAALPPAGAAGSETILPTVSVTGQAAEPPSEATGAYTTETATIGSKLPASLKETPQSISVITRQRMEDQNLTTLDEVLRQVPGVTTDLSGTAVIPAFYIRGFPVEYFQYDGVPIQTGGASWSQPDMIMFDRVEVLRGAGGLFNGAGQPGGVVNLVRKRPTATRQFSGALSAGSWDAYRAELDYSTPLNQSGSVRARVAGAYDDRHAFIDYANGQQTSLYGILEADLAPRTTASLGVGYQKRDWRPAMMGLPRYSDGGDLGLPRSTFLSTPWTYWDFQTTQVFADITHRFNSDWQLKLSAVHDHETSDLKYAYVSGAVNRATLAGPRLAGGANAYDNKQLALDAYVTGAFRAFGRRHELVFGASWYDRQADAQGGQLPGFGGTPVNVFDFSPAAIADPGAPRWTSNTRTDTKQYGLYGATRLKLADPLTLLLGGRVSWWQTNARNQLTGATTSDYRQSGRFTPYAGLVYDLTPHWSAYASYADIFRVQSNYLDTDGNALPPVTGANYEAGVKGAYYDGRLNLSLAAFRTDESNRAIAVTPTIVNSCCYASNGKVRSEGFETEVSGELLPGWQVSAGYTFNTTKYLRDATFEGQPFRSIAPKHLLRLYTNYRLPRDWNAWSVGGGMDLQSATYSQGGNPSVRVQQGGYAVFNLRAGYRFDKTWSLALNLNNLFDRRYYARLGTAGAFGPANFGNVYGTPRNVMVTLRAKL